MSCLLPVIIELGEMKEMNRVQFVLLPFSSEEKETARRGLDDSRSVYAGCRAHAALMSLMMTPGSS